MKKPSEIEEENPPVSALAFYSGVDSDLGLLDLTKFNARFLNTKSEEFKSFIETTEVTDNDSSTNRNRNAINRLEKEIEKHDLWALIPININKPVDSNIFFKIEQGLLILFPSSFQMIESWDIQVIEKKSIWWISTTHVTHNFHLLSSTTNHLRFDAKDSRKIVDFLIKFKDQSLNKLQLILIQSYHIALRNTQFFHFRFIQLCICLETTCTGTTELTYRIARNCAIICGKDLESSNTIFLNVKKLYTLRSKIVHGEDYKEDLLAVYVNYLSQLCSRVIIELLQHSSLERKELNEKTTSVGYGDYAKLSDSYLTIIPDQDKIKSLSEILKK